MKHWNTFHSAQFNIVPIEGDVVTFIGTTFMTAGEKQPYLNHGICLTDCGDVPMEDSKSEIVCCDTGKRVVIGMDGNVIRREKPDVIIGYNIFGFDWKFLCERAEENQCYKPKQSRFWAAQEGDEEEDGKPQWFSQLSKNKQIYCRKMEKEIRIASGAHLLTYVKIDGIIQIDLYNYFRRRSKPLIL